MPRITKSILSNMLLVVSSLILLWLVVGLTRYAWVAPPSFDGAMNLNTAVSLIRGEGYGFFYNNFFPFPAKTDGPFILPAALILWFGGITPITAQATNLGYALAFALLGLILFKRFELPAWLSVIGILGYFSTPGFYEFGMNGFGEVPVMVWYFAGLLMIGKAIRITDGSIYLHFIGGFLFSFAYLTKTVALIVVVPAFIVVFLLTVGKPRWLISLLGMAFGFLLPVICWEVFRFIELGGVNDFLQWWRLQFDQVLDQSGAKQAGVNSDIFVRGAEHFSILSVLVGVPIVFLFFYLVVPIGLAIKCAFNKLLSKERRFYFGCLATSGALYFIWWIFINPSSMMWLRRILDGLLIVQCLAIIFFFNYFRSNESSSHAPKLKRLPRILVSTLVVIPALIGQLYLCKKGETITQPVRAPAYTTEFFQLTTAMSNLPGDALIFGTGWWQAPVLALFSGQHIYNIQRWMPSEINKVQNKFFIVDYFAKNLSGDDIANVLASIDFRVISDGEAGTLYEILYARDYAPFSPLEKDVSRLSTGADFAKGDYPYTRGFYERERGVECWIRTDAALMLKRSSETRLIVSLTVPEKLISSTDQNSLRMRVQNQDCLDEEVILNIPGKQKFEFNLTCPAHNKELPFLLVIGVNNHMPFICQIDSDNRQLSLLVQSVHLYNLNHDFE
jgi:hypothetical protein